MIHWFEKHYKISWLITILIAVIIFYLSSKTFHGTAISGKINIGIFYHFFVFFYFSFFLLISLMKGNINKKLLTFALFLAILYGISDEIHQFFVPGRDSAISDILIDSSGILLAGTLYSYRLRNNHYLLQSKSFA